MTMHLVGPQGPLTLTTLKQSPVRTNAISAQAEHDKWLTKMGKSPPCPQRRRKQTEVRVPSSTTTVSVVTRFSPVTSFVGMALRKKVCNTVVNVNYLVLL